MKGKVKKASDKFKQGDTIEGDLVVIDGNWYLTNDLLNVTAEIDIPLWFKVCTDPIDLTCCNLFELGLKKIHKRKYNELMKNKEWLKFKEL